MSSAREQAWWRTSSYSGSQGQCVEVAYSAAARIRDTKDRDGGTLTVPAPAWQSFTRQLRRG
jgi:hypothetical protein